MTHDRRFSRLVRISILVLATCAFLISAGPDGAGRNVAPGIGQPPLESSRAAPAASPTPDLGQLIGTLGKAASLAGLIKQLNDKGPQIGSFQTGNFSMKAFIKNSVMIEYQLEENAEAEVVVKFKDKKFPTFKKHLQTGTGKVVRETLVLPSVSSNEAPPGEITIRARIKTDGKTRVADFDVRSVAIGLRDLSASSEQFPVTRVSYLSLAAWSPTLSAPQLQIEVAVSPLSISAGAGEKVVYVFHPKDTFQRWAADFRAMTRQMKDGRAHNSTKPVRVYTFDEAIGPKNELRREWDGLNQSGKPSTGRNRLTIRAWRTLEKGRACFVKVADEVIEVKQ